MNQFCTSCGAVLPKQRIWRTAAILLIVFLAGVALGWWLARRQAAPCVPPPNISGTSGPADPTGGAPKGNGRPDKLGGGAGGGAISGSASGGGGPTPANSGSGASSSEGAGSGDAGGGGGNGSARVDLDSSANDLTASTAQGQQAAKLASGASLKDAQDDETLATQAPDAQVLVAKDFTYDRTGLPRYPSAQLKVASALKYDAPDDKGHFGTSAIISTSDSFDTVVQWYGAHRPSGWQQQTMPDLGVLARNMSALMPKRVGEKPTAGQPNEQVRLSMILPPQGAAGDGIMISQRGNDPVVVMMKAHLPP